MRSPVGAAQLNHMSGMIRIGPTDRVFVLTGAGISAESGLPTFRGANGLWRGHRVEEVASPIAWARDPRMVWTDRKSTRLNSSHIQKSRMPSSA